MGDPISVKVLDDLVEITFAVGRGTRNSIAISKAVRKAILYEVTRSLGVRVLGSTVQFNRSRYRVKRTVRA